MARTRFRQCAFQQLLAQVTTVDAPEAAAAAAAAVAAIATP